MKGVPVMPSGWLDLAARQVGRGRLGGVGQGALVPEDGARRGVVGRYVVALRGDDEGLLAVRTLLDIEGLRVDLGAHGSHETGENVRRGGRALGEGRVDVDPVPRAVLVMLIDGRIGGSRPGVQRRAATIRRRRAIARVAAGAASARRAAPVLPSPRAVPILGDRVDAHLRIGDLRASVHGRLVVAATTRERRGEQHRRNDTGGQKTTAHEATSFTRNKQPF